MSEYFHGRNGIPWKTRIRECAGYGKKPGNAGAFVPDLGGEGECENVEVRDLVLHFGEL
jgi:hypothetical protein